MEAKNVFLTKSQREQAIFFYDETIINHVLPYKMKEAFRKNSNLRLYSVFSLLFFRIVIVLVMLYTNEPNN